MAHVFLILFLAAVGGIVLPYVAGFESSPMKWLHFIVLRRVFERAAFAMLFVFAGYSGQALAESQSLATPPTTGGLSKEADDAIAQAERDQLEDPLVARLRSEAYDPANIKAARDVLDRHLIDYRSARIRDVAAYYVFPKNRPTNKDGSANPPILIYCGMVNAPNRMGGMAGWEMLGWTPTHIAGPNSCPGSYLETGLIRITVHRVGPVGDDELRRAFDPSVPPPSVRFD